MLFLSNELNWSGDIKDLLFYEQAPVHFLMIGCWKKYHLNHFKMVLNTFVEELIGFEANVFRSILIAIEFSKKEYFLS